MNVVVFAHSLLSDWNHGNAHFLRGVVTELVTRGHRVVCYEPDFGWSLANLVRDHGTKPLNDVRRIYPKITVERYDETIDIEEVLDGVDMVIVHEWNEPSLVARVGKVRQRASKLRALFHDTHHRSVTAPHEMERYDLSGYDGVLAFGERVREVYLERGWAQRVFTWHEAADVRVFRPLDDVEPDGDLIWVGNWGDDERTSELHEFLLGPVRALRVRARVFGVRYPEAALAALRECDIDYGGWLPNYEVPRAFAAHRLTVHVPRRPYTAALPGIPTIRPFEALACGIPLVSAPWDDCEGLFRKNVDYLAVRDGEEMTVRIREVLADDALRQSLREHGLETIRRKHTCAHRVDELLAIASDIGVANTQPKPTSTTSPLKENEMKIAFFGSSLVSAYWNGAATYYRGIIRALSERGHRVTFYEPDAFERQSHRDIEDPAWARVVVYDGQGEEGVRRSLEDAKHADLVVKASGVGVFDELLEEAVLQLQTTSRLVVFWDVDAPATLARVRQNANDAFRALIPRYDMILTYGGGPPVCSAYRALGAKDCVPIYNALDPSTHHPVGRDVRFEGDLGFLGNRLPDREQRVERFFFEAAGALPSQRFLLGGAGWDDKDRPTNVTYVGHVYTTDHNAFNCSNKAVLNISRDSMADNGWSPATRVFEAAGAGACLITDAWLGVEEFLEPEREVLVASNGAEVAEHLGRLTPERSRAIGEAARRRVMSEHTYAHRAVRFEEVIHA